MNLLHTGTWETEAGSDPHIGITVWDRKHLRLLASTAADPLTVWQTEHGQSCCSLCTLDRDASPLECQKQLGAGARVGMGQQSQGESLLLTAGEKAQRGCEEREIMVGNVGGKPGDHGDEVILLSHAWGWEASLLSFSLLTSTGS